MKSFLKLEPHTHPRFAHHLQNMKIALISHDDDTFEFLCEKPDGSWMNGRDFTSEQGALNSCFRKLEQGIAFAKPMTSQQLASALQMVDAGIAKPSPELDTYLKKWSKTHKQT